MIIDFDKIELTTIPKFKGGEKELSAHMFLDADNKILLAKLLPGATVGYHQHETSSEIIYFLKGNGKVLYDGGELCVQAGNCHYCPKGHSHGIVNDSNAPLEFFAVVPEQ